MSLDIMTPKGQESQAHLRDASILMYARTGCRMVCCPERSPGEVDGVILSPASGIVGVFEAKCRDMTVEQLVEEFGNEWLITGSKIEAIRTAARTLGVPGVGLLYLIPDRMLLLVTICDSHGEGVASVRYARTRTQATTNGGVAVRDNAFVDVTSATAIDGTISTKHPLWLFRRVSGAFSLGG